MTPAFLLTSSLKYIIMVKKVTNFLSNRVSNTLSNYFAWRVNKQRISVYNLHRNSVYSRDERKEMKTDHLHNIGCR